VSKLSSGKDTSSPRNLVSKELLENPSSVQQEGLSSTEAAKRFVQFGPNEIAERKRSRVISFLHFFWGPIPGMIEAAAIISAAIQHWEDFGVITLLLVINAVVGFWQENKASNAIELLKQRLALRAKVLRDGKWLDLPARELVPGDVVRLRLGSIVPADATLISGEYLQIDQSALTGESLPVEKHLSDLVYSSSIVRQGEMNAAVTGTGMNTYFGKTAKLVEEAQTKSHFQRAIVKIGDYLIAIAAFLVTVTSIVGLFRHQGILELLQFGLVLTVAAIPAALPAVLSVSMAVGAEALAKKEAIVSKLVAIEEMAGVDVLCADKTGTITKNELKVGEVKTLGGFSQKEVLLYGVMASRPEDKDPIDDAIIRESNRLEEDSPIPIRLAKILSFKPFDPVSKKTEATVEENDGTQFRVAKGAPQVILSLVENAKSISDVVYGGVNEFASKGYRALGVAKTDTDSKWQYVGLIALYDPPREDSAETIATAQTMGLKVKMITGDQISIAKEIASRVGLGSKIVEPSAILGKSDIDVESAVESADGFAEVFPEHKYRIVEVLQKLKHIVCMTGDGVNDAPALKKADAGIAVAGATDAAKSAATVVLTRPGLSVIIDAIKESRKIFQRMTNYAIYRISETVRVLLFVTLTIIVFQFYPVTALMIVLLALLNDLPIMTIAYDNVRYSNRPERWNMRVILAISTFLGTIGVISSFILLYVGIDVLHLTGGSLQSFIFLKLAVAGDLTVFVARTKSNFWTIRPATPLLLAAVCSQLTAILITVYGVLFTALGWELALLVYGYALAAFFVTDILKTRFYKLLNHEGIVFRR
jgi:H+-transporting ATPase